MKFDDTNLKISYSGEPIQGLYGDITVKIVLTPVNFAANPDPLTQLVFLYP